MSKFEVVKTAAKLMQDNYDNAAALRAAGLPQWEIVSEFIEHCINIKQLTTRDIYDAYKAGVLDGVYCLFDDEFEERLIQEEMEQLSGLSGYELEALEPLDYLSDCIDIDHLFNNPIEVIGAIDGIDINVVFNNLLDRTAI